MLTAPRGSGQLSCFSSFLDSVSSLSSSSGEVGLSSFNSFFSLSLSSFHCVLTSSQSVLESSNSGLSASRCIFCHGFDRTSESFLCFSGFCFERLGEVSSAASHDGLDMLKVSSRFVSQRLHHAGLQSDQFLCVFSAENSLNVGESLAQRCFGSSQVQFNQLLNTSESLSCSAFEGFQVGFVGFDKLCSGSVHYSSLGSVTSWLPDQ